MGALLRRVDENCMILQFYAYMMVMIMKAGEMDECVEALESVLSARSEHCNSEILWDLDSLFLCGCKGRLWVDERGT